MPAKGQINPAIRDEFGNKIPWKIRYPERRREVILECHARNRYGLTREEQVRLHQQPCDICGKHAKKMCIDHAGPASVYDQTYRGVLCMQCNSRLGGFED